MRIAQIFSPFPATTAMNNKKGRGANTHALRPAATQKTLANHGWINMAKSWSTTDLQQLPATASCSACHALQLVLIATLCDETDSQHQHATNQDIRPIGCENVSGVRTRDPFVENFSINACLRRHVILDSPPLRVSELDAL